MILGRWCADPHEQKPNSPNQKHLTILFIMSKSKENRELANIVNTAAAALRKNGASPSRPAKIAARSLKRSPTADQSAKATFVPNPHGEAHSAAIYLGAKPSDVPSYLAHGLAVHHGVPDQPSGAVRNPRRDHDATDMVVTIESAFNIVPDTTGALELDIYPTLHYPLRPTKGSVFSGGVYVSADGLLGFGNETEADKFEELISGVCCEAIEVTMSYVGNIEGISGELAAAAFAAGSSQLMTGVQRPSDLQTMMSYPGAKSCEATQSLHMNLPHSEFTTGFFAGTSGLVNPAPNTTPYNNTLNNWSACEHRPEKMTAPQGSAPFAPSEGSSFQLTGGNANQLANPDDVLNAPQYLSSYSATDTIYPPLKFDVLPLIRVVGGNLTVAESNTGSWLIKIKACYTGTALTHVGEMYHGASANIANSITTNAPASSTFAKTAAILQKVGAGASTSDTTTAAKQSNLVADLTAGAKKVGSFLWNTIGGWSGLGSKLGMAASLAASVL
jgi:hypothetical protein